MKSARFVPFFIGVMTLGASGAAMAPGLNVGVNRGIPALASVPRAPVYAPPPPPPPPVVYQPAPVYYGAPAVVIGWHGDRYWDGRRYWARDDWYRHHPPGRYDYRRDHYDHGRGWH